VDDGVSFCPHCNAPQIRVSAVPTELHPGSVPPRAVLPRQVAWPYALRAAVIGGGIGSILCIVLAPLLKAGFIVGMALGGAACVAIYRRRQPLARITSAVGARLGAVAGIFGFVVFASVQSLLLLAAPGAEMRQALRDAIQQAAAQNPDPKVQDMMRSLLTPEGMAAVVIAAMALFLIMFVIFGVIGGGLAAAMGRHDHE
jgi:hypothetical protein